MRLKANTATALRRYLRNGRSQLVTRPAASDLQRVIDYRTMACLAHHEAHEAGAARWVLDYMRTEHDWALGVMAEAGVVFPVVELGQMELVF